MIDIVILSGGMATRLSKYTGEGILPKILVSLGNKTLLDIHIEKIINSIQIRNVYIVVSSHEHYVMLKSELSKYNYSNINVIMYTNVDGTYNTIVNVLRMNDISENVLFQWSDIIVNDYDNIIYEHDSNKKITVYVDESGSHRVKYDGISFTRSTIGGNVPGLFYINDAVNTLNLKSFVNTDTETDITDYLMMIDNSLIQSSVVNVIDVGDVKKYEKFVNEMNISTRFFNEILILHDCVVKSALNFQGENVMTKELNFYKRHYQLQGDIIPKILDYSFESPNVFISMERLSGITVNEFINKNDPHHKDTGVLSKVFEMFMQSINVLHNFAHLYPTEISVIKSSIYNEYVKTTFDRIRAVKHFLPVDFAILNNSKIPSVNELFVNIKKYFDKFDENYFKCIHGDPNTTNTMIVNDKLIFIDPRGIFGGIDFYGDYYYDIAKFIYGLHGYDSFNLDRKFSLTVKHGELYYFDMSKYGYSLDMIDKVLENYDFDIKRLHVILGIIFMKLSSYIRNNPLKSIASYLYGAQMIQKELHIK